MNPLLAGTAYFAIVFAAGFMFGTLRVLLVAPYVGPLFAVLIEMPFMLGIAWLVCRTLMRRMNAPNVRTAGIVMGATAFVLLMAGEYLLALGFNGVTVSQYMAQIATPPGLLGLAGQVAFAAFPVLQTKKRVQTSSTSTTPGTERNAEAMRGDT